MSKNKIQGSFVAIVTPFNRDGSVDFSAFRSLLKFQEDHGTAAVLIMGSTGEVSLLSPEERRQVIVETAKMKTGKMQLFYGCTGNNTDTTIEYLKFARENGADGAILAPRPTSARPRPTPRPTSSKWPTPPTCRWASTTTRPG